MQTWTPLDPPPGHAQPTWAPGTHAMGMPVVLEVLDAVDLELELVDPPDPPPNSGPVLELQLPPAATAKPQSPSTSHLRIPCLPFAS